MTGRCGCRIQTGTGEVDDEAAQRSHNAMQRWDPFSSKEPNTIAICAIMKDERAEDVKEFIDYHRWIGVDSFFLRENQEECAIKAELQPYIDAGILDLGLLPGPKHPTQTNWYNTCSKKASKKHRWIAFIDLDEFMIVLHRCVSPAFCVFLIS
jgi:hypothetical protein